MPRFGVDSTRGSDITTNSPTSDFADLRAMFINTTLKRSPEVSNTQGLLDVSAEIMRRQGVAVDLLRAADHDIATGVQPDMTEHGWDEDEWPEIYERVLAADILVIGSPIWLGERSSVCSKVIERLYSNSAQLNDKGQFAYYGRVAGCIVTGNEDGVKHCATSILYAMQHLGYAIPPQPMRDGSGRSGQDPHTWTKGRAGRKTTSPTETPPS